MADPQRMLLQKQERTLELMLQAWAMRAGMGGDWVPSSSDDDDEMDDEEIRGLEAEAEMVEE